MAARQSNIHFLHCVAGFNLATQFAVITFLMVPQMAIFA